MGKSSANISFTKVLFGALAVIFIMALCDIGPFSKGNKSTPEESSFYHPSTGSGQAKYISFGHRPTSTCRRFDGYSRGGTYHCTITVYDSDPNTAYINDSNQGCQIYRSTNYDDHGSFFCYWGSVAIYF